MAAKLASELSQRDQETLRRLFRRGAYNKIQDLYVRWSASGQLGVQASKKGGRRRATKQRQALLVALCWLRNYHKLNRSVRNVAADIFKTVEIRFKHSIKGPSKPYASSAALEEYLRYGLKNQAVKAVGQWIWYLFWWRKNAVNHNWGFGCDDKSLSFAVTPRNIRELLKWIDAAMASDDFRDVAAGFDDPTSPVQPTRLPRKQKAS
jgi:hypothetical protein